MTARPDPLVVEIDPERLGRAVAGIEAAAEALARGRLVILPTETVYGLACRPDLPAATARVFEAKRRASRLSLPVLAPDAGSAWEIGRPTPVGAALGQALWPGALTLVLPRAEASRRWELGEDAETVAVRVPDHPLSQALLRRAGPLAATSANESGSPPLAGVDDLLAAFGRDVAVFLVLAVGAPPPLGRPSTVVDATGDRPVVLRAGALDETRLQAALAAPAPPTRAKRRLGRNG